jgi:hypothetical protein
MLKRPRDLNALAKSIVDQAAGVGVARYPWSLTQLAEPLD